MAKELKGGTDIDIASELKDLGRKSKRMDAVARLGQAGADEAVVPLLDLCERVKGSERSAIAHALAQIGGPAVRRLVKHGLGARSPRTRWCAVHALALMGEGAAPAYEPLLKALDDQDEDVRLGAIAALGEIGSPDAVGPLVTLLDDEDEEVRVGAAAALGALGEAALDAVSEVCERTDSMRARAAAAYALSQIGGRAAEERLRGAFDDRTHNNRVRVVILSLLCDLLGEDIVPLADAALAEESRQIRRQAVRCLASVSTGGATARLAALYDDADKKVRALALRALQVRYKVFLDRVEARDLDALPVLLATWRSMGKKQRQASEAISGALARIGPPLVPALLATLDPERPGADVIDVLAQIGPGAAAVAGAYEALVAQLDHPHIATCGAAARALGSLGDERALPVLAARLSFDAGLLRAEKHVDKLARKRALALQAAAAEGLGRLGKVALPVALSAARSDDPGARLGGVIALGHIGGGRALATVERATSDRDDRVREAAAEAMERLSAQDVTRLGRMIVSEDDRVRARAVKALSRLDDLRSLDLLLRAYGDPSARVRRAVVEALACREGERANSILIAAAAGGDTNALRALQEHPVRQAIPALLEALDAPWSEVYGAALESFPAYVEAFAADEEAMGDLRGAIPELTGLLQDPSAKARRGAIRALAAYRDPGTVRDIAYLMVDEKPSVRKAAVECLATIGGKEAVTLLKARLSQTRDDDLREEIEDALEDLEEESE